MHDNRFLVVFEGTDLRKFALIGNETMGNGNREVVVLQVKYMLVEGT